MAVVDLNRDGIKDVAIGGGNTELFETGSRQGHFFGFAFLHRGHARHSAVDRFSPKPRRRLL